MAELVGRNLPQSFKTRDFRILAERFDSRQFFLLAITINRLLPVAHAEERRLQDIDMLLLNQIREELKEECDKQEADVHPVHIGIGRDNHFVITQSIQSIFNIQSRLQEVELLVFIHDFFREAITIERFSPQTEHGLEIGVAALGDGTAGRIPLGDEYTRFFRLISFRVIQMNAAIAQFLIMEIGFLCPFACQFRHACDGLAFLFRILYFF